MSKGGFVYPAGEHAGELAAAFFAFDFVDFGEGAAVCGGFGYDYVGDGFGCYLGEVGYGEYLVAPA